jgi:hypothetical protein
MMTKSAPSKLRPAPEHDLRQVRQEALQSSANSARVPPTPPEDAARLDAERLRSLLIELNGNITKAAERLRVDSAFLRGFVDRIPRLRLALAEIMERGVDQAVDILYEGLADQASFQNRFYSAKEMLKSDAGRRRGYGREISHNLEIKPVTRGSLEIKWIDPPKHDLEGPVPDPIGGPLIEHEGDERKDHEGDR